MLCYLLLAAVAHAAPASDPLIDDLMSAPFASGLTAADDSEQIAWIETTRGQRSIWTAAAPSFAARRLALFADDDGQELGDLRFSSDGRELWFVRGGPANDAGLHPNPGSLTQKSEQAAWHVPVQGGEAIQAAPGTSPFTPQTLFHAAGGQTDFTWRPDGAALAFVSRRGDHSFVGLYQPSRNAIEWVAPDTSRDLYPTWSPSGKSLAFLRVPGEKRGEAPDFSRNTRFEVWTYDVASKQARAVWKSPGADGTSYAWARTPPMLWADETTLIFTSEHEGWWRSYRLDVVDGRVVPLSPASCEVFGHAISGSRYVASTNCGHLDRRQLSVLDLRTGATSVLTQDDGIETLPAILRGARYVAFTRSSATQPQAIYVRDLKTRQLRRVSLALELAFSRLAQAIPEAVSFASAAPDKAEIHGQLYAAKGAGKRPALLFLHGGPVRQMLLGWSDLDYYDRMYAIGQYFAARGYVVLSVNYRATVGYGKTYRTVAGLGPHGALDLQDVIGGARYLQSRADVDPRRIGIYGGSYGGYLTALALARHSDIFKAGVDVHGVHDWAAFAVEAPLVKGGGWGIVGADATRIAYESSPVAALDTWQSPVLLVHGDQDRNVRFGQTVDLSVRLRDRAVAVETLILPDEDHHLTRQASWDAIARAASAFFDRYLRGDAE